MEVILADVLLYPFTRILVMVHGGEHFIRNGDHYLDPCSSQRPHGMLIGVKNLDFFYSIIVQEMPDRVRRQPAGGDRPLIDAECGDVRRNREASGEEQASEEPAKRHL